MTTSKVSYNLAGAVRNMSLPVAGTTIRLFDYWSTGQGLVRHLVSEQVTGSKGEFNFAVRMGIYCLEVVPNRDTRFARQSIDNIKITNNTTLNISLKTGCVFSGKVRTTDGTVLPDCEILVYGIEPHTVRASEPVEANGRFSIALTDGKYYVACRHQESLVEDDERKSSPYLSSTFHLIDLRNDLKQDLVLPDLVRFVGIINDAEGHPVPDCKVTIKPSSPPESMFAEEANLFATCYSDHAGQFSCDVEPGTYDVKLEPGPDMHLSERLVSSILVDQPRTRTYALGAGYHLHGFVRHEGKPVENALVSVFGGKTDSSVLTNSKGRFSFSLSGGSYELVVTAQPDSLAERPFRALAPFVTTVSLAEDTRKDVELHPGTEVVGKVFDQAARPRSGVQLALYQHTEKPLEECDPLPRPIAFGITGDDGAYEFRAEVGKYWLVLNGQLSGAQRFEVTEDGISRDLRFNDACLVNFEVVSEFDEPVANCRVMWEKYGHRENGDGEAGNGVHTADDGVCQLVVPAGIYTFRFEPPHHGSFQPKLIRQLSVNSDVTRKVKLALKNAPGWD